MSLPGVSELLRGAAPGIPEADGRQASGREAHPQKITVYLSSDEYLDLERARLSLRTRGISVDRGRLVREAIALLLADLDAGVDASLLARRLAGPTTRGLPGPASGGHGVGGLAPGGALNGQALAGDGVPAGGAVRGGLNGQAPVGPQG